MGHSENLDHGVWDRLNEFQVQTGICFKDRQLLITAFTHSSYARYNKKGRVQDNERLEFFGDAVLKLIVSDYLLRKFPTHSEGELTKIRAQLISDRNLAFLAEKLNIGDYLMMSYGEKNTGGDKRISNLANTMEALLGAYFLDSGLEKTQLFFTNLLVQHELELLAQDYVIDYKTSLQEYLQRRKLPLPDYRIDREEGPDHEKVFHVVVSVMVGDKPVICDGSGRSKKEAEQMAAKTTLVALNQGI